MFLMMTAHFYVIAGFVFGHIVTGSCTTCRVLALGLCVSVHLISPKTATSHGGGGGASETPVVYAVPCKQRIQGEVN
jgi:hypothetical protein